MKKIKKCLLIGTLIFIIIQNTNAQTNNWRRLDSVKNIARLYGGLDYGIVYGLHYGRIIKTKNIIWIPFADVSLPLGNNPVDDYKFKVGTTAKVFQYKSWIASVDVSIINRQNKNPFVRMHSLGSESGFQIGYYKSKWFVNFNFSTDNSLTTHLKHSDAYKGNYSGVKDGWYQNTANNFSIGGNLGVSFGRSDITLKLGQIFTQNFKTKPSLPIYIQIGYNYKF
jgi:hypothetical protein